MSEGSQLVVPLLNNYKHGLLRRRLFQTLLGGVRIRKVPWYIYLIQAGLWTFPLGLSIPFIVIDGLDLWSKYLLALLYGITQGTLVLVEGLVIYLLRLRQRRNSSETNQFDDEQDTVEILSCCSMDVIEFIFSSKRIFSVLLHPFASGALLYVGVFLLQPSVLQEFLPTTGVVLVSLVGWFTICSSHYSLSVRASPEIAIYRPTDPLELKFLNRPFHVILIGIIFILLRLLTGTSSLYFQLLYSCLCLLPLGWMLGVLPPIDALIPWILEQALVKFLGGSPMATDLRLWIMFWTSFILVAIVVSLVSDVLLFALLMATFGFLLSQDNFSNFKAFLCLLSFKKSNRITRYIYSSLSKVFTKTFISYSGINDVHLMRDVRSFVIFLLISTLKGSVILAGGLVCVYFTSKVQDPEKKMLMTRIFSGITISFCAIVLISDSIQRPYILGIVRNFLFPKSASHVAKFKSQRKKLSYASFPRKVLLSLILPLVMLALVGLNLNSSNENIPLVWQRIATARLFRAIWQNTVSTLHELAVVSILTVALPVDNVWISLGFSTQAFIVGLILDVTKDFVQKLAFVLTSLIVFTSKPKHRIYLPLTILIVAGSVIFSPLLIGVILISSILSAPLLPLFTLPIFFISFPRARHFWPSLSTFGTTYLKSTDETIYYQHAESRVAKAVHSSLSCGAVPSQPGTQLLIRFENKLALVSVLEVGCGFCTISMRGLELQEQTSCHSEEAAHVDNMIETLYSPNPCSQPCNTNFLDTLLLVDSVAIETYSDARNVLTGIIDQPTALQHFSSILLKSLIWVFNRHMKSNVTAGVTCIQDIEEGTNCVKTSGNTKDSGNTNDAINNSSELSPKSHGRRFSMVAWKEDRSKSLFTTYLGEETVSWSSVSSITDPQKANRMQVANTLPVDSWMVGSPPPRLIPEDIPLEEEIEEIENVLVRNQMGTVLPPLPGEHRESILSEFITPSGNSVETLSYCTWQHPPLSHIQIFRLMQQFPHQWYAYLNDRVPMDSDRFELLSKVVVGCFSILDVPAQTSLSSNATSVTYPLDIYRRFCGNIPRFEHYKWLTEHTLLRKLALKSYRYAVKLMYDEGCLGEAESWEELNEYFTDYDQNWCIVRETEVEWETAILSNTPHLFSLGHDPKKSVYTAHVLSLQDELLHIGALNQTALEGLWADLALELFYMTNDDEERYSIQAHTYLLRNLSIQTAEPPLGHSVYASGIITVPLT